MVECAVACKSINLYPHLSYKHCLTRLTEKEQDKKKKEAEALARGDVPMDVEVGQ
jgi:hypothetical protein